MYTKMDLKLYEFHTHQSMIAALLFIFVRMRILSCSKWGEKKKKP